MWTPSISIEDSELTHDGDRTDVLPKTAENGTFQKLKIREFGGLPEQSQYNPWWILRGLVSFNFAPYPCITQPGCVIWCHQCSGSKFMSSKICDVPSVFGNGRLCPYFVSSRCLRSPGQKIPVWRVGVIKKGYLRGGGYGKNWDIIDVAGWWVIVGWFIADCGQTHDMRMPINQKSIKGWTRGTLPMWAQTCTGTHTSISNILLLSTCSHKA